MMHWLSRFEQLVKEGVEVNHRLSEILSACMSLFVLNRDFVCGPIVHHHVGMVDRNIRHALLEIGDGVTTCPHHFSNEHVCFADCSGGVIHEPGLHATPCAGEGSCILSCEGAYVELLNPLRTIFERHFSAANASNLSYCTVVFRTKFLHELLPPLSAKNGPTDRADDQHCDDDQRPN
jgi:hypothetical protein